MVSAAEIETMVTELMTFGYLREQVMGALKAAYYHPDRAYEYLGHVCLNCLCVYNMALSGIRMFLEFGCT